MQGVYVPFWTFDAATHSAWEAEAGTQQQVQVDGRVETRVRWEHVSGFLEKFFDDLPVAAYDYRGAPYRFLVNGVTGRVSGRAPWSALKIALALLAALAILLVFSMLSR